MSQPVIYRQGDVGLMPVDEVPKEAKVLKSRLLRRGEHGGLHMLEKKADTTLVEHEGVKYILSETGVKVVHGEHNHIDLPAGKYRVQVQREMRGYVYD